MNLYKKSFQALSFVAAAFKLSYAMEANQNSLEDVNPFLNAKPHFETTRLEKMFENVTFHPPFVFVKNTTQYHTEGDLFVHFSDVSQIQNTLEKGVNLSAKGSVYYIKDLKQGEPIRYTSDRNLETTQAIYVDGVRGLKLVGRFEISNSSLILPRNYDVHSCLMNGKNGIICTLQKVNERKQLIKILKKFDHNTFDTRTEDANHLMKIIKERSKRSQFNSNTLSNQKNLLMFSDKSIQESVIDQISSKKPFAIVANNISGIKEKESNFNLSDHFNLILPSIEKSGFYSRNPFYLTDMHILKCDGDLVVLGSLNLPDSGLTIHTKNLWSFTHGNINTFILKSSNYFQRELSDEVLEYASINMPRVLFEKLLSVITSKKH